MKPIRFLGDSLKNLRQFPKDVRQDAGYQLEKVQDGETPDDFQQLADAVFQKDGKLPDRRVIPAARRVNVRARAFSNAHLRSLDSRCVPRHSLDNCLAGRLGGKRPSLDAAPAAMVKA